MAVALTASACASRRVVPQALASSAPTTEVIATGDGKIASAVLGPRGGRVDLGPAAGPGVEVPQDTTGSAGLSVSVVLESDADLPKAAALVGSPFRATVALVPTGGRRIGVHSEPLDAIPSACVDKTLELAVEQSPAAASANGAPIWAFFAASWEGKVAAAELASLEPVRLQFVCGAEN
jgi:hypothetical protein